MKYGCKRNDDTERTRWTRSGLLALQEIAESCLLVGLFEELVRSHKRKQKDYANNPQTTFQLLACFKHACLRVPVAQAVQRALAHR